MNYLFLVPFILLLMYHVWYVITINKERKDWMRAIMSKSSYEFVQTEPEVIKEAVKEANKPSPYVDSQDLTDDEFLEAINNKN